MTDAAPDPFTIADILVAHALAAHEGEIAIIAYYGSQAKGTATPSSDLDLFYIPDAGKAESLCTQFVLDGLPYDFWPISWDFAEQLAEGRSGRPWAVSASLIADAKVLYARSGADRERFEALQARVVELTQPASRQEMVERALNAFDEVLVQQGQLRLAMAAGDEQGLRLAGQSVVNAAVNCLALVNQTYFSKGWGGNMPQILTLPQKRPALAAQIETVLFGEEPEAVEAAAAALVGDVRALLLAEQAAVAEPEPVQQAFRDFYFFVLEYAHKVEKACARGDAVTALYAATQLQQEIALQLNKTGPGFWGGRFNLLGEYGDAYAAAGFPDLIAPAAAKDLAILAARARELDEQVQAWLEAREVPLNVLEDAAALRRFLQARDPAPERAG